MNLDTFVALVSIGRELLLIINNVVGHELP